MRREAVKLRTMPKTVGEQTFERYLVSRGINDFKFEHLVEGKKRPPDYTVTRDRDYLFEVKDFQPEENLLGGAYDPYARVRAKIDAARKKFQEYEGWPCALVLYNNGAALVDITKPNFVLGAMYGNAGIVIPFNRTDGEPAGEIQEAFLGGGKMVRPHWKEPANTRISALVSLRYVYVGSMRRQKQFANLTSDAVGRVARAADIFRQICDAKFDFDPNEAHLGVIVWENAFASIPFPRDLFAGDYDEIYGVEEDRQPRVFAGKGVLEYEALAESVRIPSIFDIVKKEKPSQ